MAEIPPGLNANMVNHAGKSHAAPGLDAARLRAIWRSRDSRKVLMFGFLKRNPNAECVERLNDAVIAQARQPVFYSALGVPDTMDGRFEMVALHAALIVRKLNNEAEPGPAIARDLTDAIFARFEVALRETGVSDIAVPKRMKKLAANYLGRTRVYDEGLMSGDNSVLTDAVARNILGQVGTGGNRAAFVIANYARQAENALGLASVEQVYECRFEWPVVVIADDG